MQSQNRTDKFEVGRARRVRGSFAYRLGLGKPGQQPSSPDRHQNGSYGSTRTCVAIIAKMPALSAWGSDGQAVITDLSSG